MDRYRRKLAAPLGDDLVFMKALRIVGKLSLADAVEIHGYARANPETVLVAGIDRSVADRIAAHFAEAGVAIVVESASLTTPMICAPQADVACRARAFGTGCTVDEST